MVASCQLHVPGYFTVEETAPETPPVRDWVAPGLDKKHSNPPTFRHHLDSTKTTASSFTILRADEMSAVCGLWPERSEIQFPAGSKVFSLVLKVNTRSGTQPASSSMGIFDSFNRGKKRPWQEVDTSEVKNKCSHTSTPFIRCHGVQRGACFFMFYTSLVNSKRILQ